MPRDGLVRKEGAEEEEECRRWVGRWVRMGQGKVRRCR